jgi:hypothetical protein
MYSSAVVRMDIVPLWARPGFAKGSYLRRRGMNLPALHYRQLERKCGLPAYLHSFDRRDEPYSRSRPFDAQ